MTKDWIIAALERGLEREGTEAAAVRDEIKQRGTWTAPSGRGVAQGPGGQRP
jgi:hypothetical protein